MSQTVTLGGDRLGSGHKQTVELHNYEMTSFNLEQDWKSSMAPGILYPFLKLVATNHGTFDIDLDSFVRTLPTQGPLFGSFKLQLDLFAVPFRLYQGLLHNNPVTLGMKMNQVYLPKLRIETAESVSAKRVLGSSESTHQINESALLKYLGLSGIGRNTGYLTEGSTVTRKINAIPALAYYDIFKNYYANKQEEYAYVIGPGTPFFITQEISEAKAYYGTGGIGQDAIITNGNVVINPVIGSTNAKLLYFTIDGPEPFDMEAMEFVISYINNEDEQDESTPLDYETWAEDEVYFRIETQEGNKKRLWINWDELENTYGTKINGITLIPSTYDNYQVADIQLKKFNLQNIDDMRNALLSANAIGQEFVIGDGLSDNWGKTSGTGGDGLPYSVLFRRTESDINWNAFAMNGLVLKTYQSDLFNNWLDTEYIDGENGISAISSVAVVSNKFSMDSLNLAEKIYEYLNRILVSGGTYEDWQEATYGQGAVRKAETPMYIGGMSSEVMFEEVIATTEMNGADQALGSLGGKGTQVGKNGGNNIHVKCDEPSYILGIVSLTPRICYSQGNDWDLTELDTMDDLHKPALDGIGFQDLIIEQMAWWDTIMDENTGNIFNRRSAGKQIAWINYQTAVDKCFGDFAKSDNGYAFMVLNRNYEQANDYEDGVKDVTTYIDPAKFNYAFAYSKLDAQNFWVQIHSKVIARRKMAGKQIPNL